MGNKFKGVVKYLTSNVFGKEGKQITTQVDAWRAEANCGCGIDCCYKSLVLKDQSTGVATYIYIEDGEVRTTVNPKEDLNKD